VGLAIHAFQGCNLAGSAGHSPYSQLRAKNNLGRSCGLVGPWRKLDKFWNAAMAYWLVSLIIIVCVFRIIVIEVAPLFLETILRNKRAVQDGWFSGSGHQGAHHFTHEQ
jgi:hypothetical protein